MQEELFSMLPFKAVQIQQKEKEVQPVDNPGQPKGILRPTTEAPVVKPKNIGQLAEIAGNAICGKANQPQVTKPDPPKTVAKPDPPKTDKKVLPTQNNVAFGTRAPLPPNNPAAKITRPVHQPYMTPTAKEIQALKAVVEEQKTVISTLSEMITGLKNEVQHLKDQNANRDLQYDKLLELIDNQNLRLMKLEKLGPNIGKKTLGAMNELKKPKDSVALKKMTNNVARRERYDEEDPKCMYNMCMEYLKEHPEMVKTVKNQTIVTSNFEDRENKQPYQTMQSLTYSMQRIQLKSPTRYKVPISVAIDAVVGDANDGSPIRRNNVKRNRERSYVEEVDSSEDEDEEESNEEDESESVEEGYEDEEDDESDDESFRAEYSRPPDQFNEDDHIFSSTVQQSRPKKQNVASRLEKARRR